MSDNEEPLSLDDLKEEEQLVISDFVLSQQLQSANSTNNALRRAIEEMQLEIDALRRIKLDSAEKRSYNEIHFKAQIDDARIRVVRAQEESRETSARLVEAQAAAAALEQQVADLQERFSAERARNSANASALVYERERELASAQAARNALAEVRRELEEREQTCAQLRREQAEGVAEADRALENAVARVEEKLISERDSRLAAEAAASAELEAAASQAADLRALLEREKALATAASTAAAETATLALTAEQLTNAAQVAVLEAELEESRTAFEEEERERTAERAKAGHELAMVKTRCSNLQSTVKGLEGRCEGLVAEAAAAATSHGAAIAKLSEEMRRKAEAELTVSAAEAEAKIAALLREKEEVKAELVGERTSHSSAMDAVRAGAAVEIKRLSSQLAVARNAVTREHELCAERIRSSEIAANAASELDRERHALECERLRAMHESILREREAALIEAKNEARSAAEVASAQADTLRASLSNAEREARQKASELDAERRLRAERSRELDAARAMWERRLEETHSAQATELAAERARHKHEVERLRENADEREREWHNEREIMGLRDAELRAQLSAARESTEQRMKTLQERSDTMLDNERKERAMEVEALQIRLKSSVRELESRLKTECASAREAAKAAAAVQTALRSEKENATQRAREMELLLADSNAKLALLGSQLEECERLREEERRDASKALQRSLAEASETATAQRSQWEKLIRRVHDECDEVVASTRIDSAAATDALEAKCRDLSVRDGELRKAHSALKDSNGRRDALLEELSAKSSDLENRNAEFKTALRDIKGRNEEIVWLKNKITADCEAFALERDSMQREVHVVCTEKNALALDVKDLQSELAELKLKFNTTLDKLQKAEVGLANVRELNAELQDCLQNERSKAKLALVRHEAKEAELLRDVEMAKVAAANRAPPPRNLSGCIVSCSITIAKQRVAHSTMVSSLSNRIAFLTNKAKGYKREMLRAKREAEAERITSAEVHSAAQVQARNSADAIAALTETAQKLREKTTAQQVAADAAAEASSEQWLAERRTFEEKISELEMELEDLTYEKEEQINNANEAASTVAETLADSKVALAAAEVRFAKDLEVVNDKAQADVAALQEDIERERIAHDTTRSELIASTLRIGEIERQSAEQEREFESQRASLLDKIRVLNDEIEKAENEAEMKVKAMQASWDEEKITLKRSANEASAEMQRSIYSANVRAQRAEQAAKAAQHAFNEERDSVRVARRRSESLISELESSKAATESALRSALAQAEAKALKAAEVRNAMRNASYTLGVRTLELRIEGVLAQEKFKKEVASLMAEHTTLEAELSRTRDELVKCNAIKSEVEVALRCAKAELRLSVEREEEHAFALSSALKDANMKESAVAALEREISELRDEMVKWKHDTANAKASGRTLGTRILALTLHVREERAELMSRIADHEQELEMLRSIVEATDGQRRALQSELASAERVRIELKKRSMALSKREGEVARSASQLEMQRTARDLQKVAAEEVAKLVAQVRVLTRSNEVLQSELENARDQIRSRARAEERERYDNVRGDSLAHATDSRILRNLRTMPRDLPSTGRTNPTKAVSAGVGFKRARRDSPSGRVRISASSSWADGEAAKHAKVLEAVLAQSEGRNSQLTAEANAQRSRADAAVRAAAIAENERADVARGLANAEAAGINAEAAAATTLEGLRVTARAMLVELHRLAAANAWLVAKLQDAEEHRAAAGVPRELSRRLLAEIVRLGASERKALEMLEAENT